MIIIFKRKTTRSTTGITIGIVNKDLVIAKANAITVKPRSPELILHQVVPGRFLVDSILKVKRFNRHGEQIHRSQKAQGQEL